MRLHREGRRIFQLLGFKTLEVVRRCWQQLVSFMTGSIQQQFPSDRQPIFALNIRRRMDDNSSEIEVFVRARNFRPGEPGLQARRSHDEVARQQPAMIVEPQTTQDCTTSHHESTRTNTGLSAERTVSSNAASKIVGNLGA